MRKYILLSILLCSVSAFALKIEKSESKFFPKILGDKLVLFKSFETFWWGFVVVEPVKNGQGHTPHEVCVLLKESRLFQRVECEQSPETYKDLISDWAGDLPLREKPPANLRAQFLNALGRASLPMPTEMLGVLREDPLETYEGLIHILKDRLRLPFEREQGIFVDSSTGRAVIPVQPHFGTDQSEKLEPLRKNLKPNAFLLGPHASTLENKAQITLDLGWVSGLGIAVTVFYILLFLYLKQLRLSILLLPAFVGAALAAATIDLFQGSIHGLTLCFGTGIIGLTVDFGLHAAFHAHSKQVWKSIFSAFFTTLLCLLVIAFTEIPLLRELMYFSLLGFIYSYLIYYMLRHQISKYLAGKEKNIPLKGNGWASALSAVLALGLILGLILVKPAFDFKQFDFQSSKTKELSQWLYPKTVRVPPLFQVYSGSFDDAVEKSHGWILWAKEKNIFLESIGNYVPLKEGREKNLSEWKKLQCGRQNVGARLNKEEKVLFSPFLEKIECNTLVGKDVKFGKPKYLDALVHDQSYLSLWLPQSVEQAKEVQTNFPEAQSLSELTTAFSKILSQEVFWMLPLSLILITAYLLFYYKNIFYAFCGIVPFLLGCGAIAWAAILLHFPLSFMTLMALIMLLGSSVDYGIFATDAVCFAKDRSEINKTTTAMLLSSLTTILGFIPLLACKHQVLFQLGASLSLGVLGTLVGTYFTVPAIIDWKRARESR